MEKDLELIRAGPPGSALFALNVVIRWHKGYHGTNRLIVCYNLQPAQSINHIHMDAPLLALIVLFRRGCFGTRTLQDIINGSDRKIMITETTLLRQALFLSGVPKGTGVGDKPMMYKAASETWFKGLARKAGFSRVSFTSLAVSKVVLTLY